MEGAGVKRPISDHENSPSGVVDDPYRHKRQRLVNNNVEAASSTAEAEGRVEGGKETLEYILQCSFDTQKNTDDCIHIADDQSSRECLSSTRSHWLRKNDAEASSSTAEGSSRVLGGMDTLEYTPECTFDNQKNPDDYMHIADEQSSHKSLSSASSPKTVVLSDDEQSNYEAELDSRETINLDVLSNASPSTLTPARLKWKETSLTADADTIARICPSANDSLVLHTLAEHRADPQRLDIAMTTALDSNTRPDYGVNNNSVLSASTSAGRLADMHSTSRQAVTLVDNFNTKKVDVGRIATDEVSRSEVMDGLFRDVTKVLAVIQAVQPELKPTVAQVATLVIENCRRPDRVEFVCSVLLEDGSGASGPEQSQVQSPIEDLFNQATLLAAEFPQQDPSLIYELLEKSDHPDSRLEAVRNKLRQGLISPVTVEAHVSGTAPTVMPDARLAREDSISKNPLVAGDLVFKDMLTVSCMFPEKDQNEVYAMIEAHYYEQDRVQKVIEELLQEGRNSQSIPLDSLGDANNAAEQSVAGVSGPTALLPGKSLPELGDRSLQEGLSHLLNVFPDCDPNYLFERLESSKGVPNRLTTIVVDMFEHRNYPRLKDVEEKQMKASTKRRLHSMNFTIEEFLAKFPDPMTTFQSTEKEMRPNYTAHVDAFIKHYYAQFKTSYFTSLMVKHRSHLIPILKELDLTVREYTANGGKSKKLRVRYKVPELMYPEQPEELFFYELWFSRHEQQVQDYFSQKAAAHKAKVEEARAKSELYTCDCCCEDELLFEDLNTCPDGHLFCRQCIARSVETAFGEGITTYPCLTGTCKQCISLPVLKDILPSSFFSKVLQKMQEEEVRQAGIQDLVECPFCSFATIMPDPSDKVFHCLNPECLKDSCRLCRELNHIPLKCGEGEGRKETAMRTFIEKRVTEAMLRKCQSCGKHFVKVVGCNMMHCVCGATSCYICRKPWISYNHFNKKCQEGNMKRLHQREMEEAAKAAKEEYLRLHPEAADIELKHDPLKLLQQPGTLDGDSDDAEEIFDEEDDYTSEEEEDMFHDDDDLDGPLFNNEEDDYTDEQEMFKEEDDDLDETEEDLTDEEYTSDESDQDDDDDLEKIKNESETVT